MFKRLLHGVQRFEVATEDWACCGSLFCCIKIIDFLARLKARGDHDETKKRLL